MNRADVTDLALDAADIRRHADRMIRASLEVSKAINHADVSASQRAYLTANLTDIERHVAAIKARLTK